MIKVEHNITYTHSEVTKMIKLILTLKGVMYKDLIRRLIKEYVALQEDMIYSLNKKRKIDLYLSAHDLLFNNNIGSVTDWLLVGSTVPPTKEERLEIRNKEELRDFKNKHWFYCALKPFFSDKDETELRLYNMYLKRTFNTSYF